MENLEQEIGVGAGIGNTRLVSVWQTTSLTLWDKAASPEGSPGTGRCPGCPLVPSISFPTTAQGHQHSASAAHIDVVQILASGAPSDAQLVLIFLQ